MTGNEYQKLAMRTNDRKATERISDKLDLLKFCKKNNIASALQDYDLGGIFNSCLGLSGEVGEFNDMIKKWIFHEKQLKARYPEGFDIERANHRAEGDV